MRAHDLPPRAGAHPGLALPTLAAGVEPLEFGVRGGKIPSERGDDGPLELPTEVDVAARPARPRDRLRTVAVVVEAEAHHQRVVPERGFEHGNVVRDQSRLIAAKCLRHLHDDRGNVDLHATPFGRAQTMRAATTPSASRCAA